jgi:hypothetical protein
VSNFTVYGEWLVPPAACRATPSCRLELTVSNSRVIVARGLRAVSYFVAETLVPQPRPITTSTPLRVLDLRTPVALGACFRSLRDREIGGFFLLRDAKRAGRLGRCRK